jgi:polar amino acid transport system permease protein
VLAVSTNPFKPFFWVVLVLSLHKAAFHAEALRAGFDALPSQTLEGAASLGFSRATRFWRIELPLALRAALPALVNNMVELVKASAVASAIAVGDVTYQSIMIWTQRDNVLALMLLILAFFGVLTWMVTLAGRWLERRYRIPGYGY